MTGQREADRRAQVEQAAWDAAGDALLDSDIGGEDDDPDAWPLAREALASELLSIGLAVLAGTGGEDED